jgi:regulatory protein
MTDKSQKEAVSEAIRLLGLRAHSRGELAAKLKKKGFDAHSIDGAMGKLDSLGLIDDRGYAAGCLESMSKRRPAGKGVAKMRLLRKGVPEELADEALKEYDSEAMCLAAAQKKMRSLPGTPETKRKKVETFLRNRGFDWHTIRESLSKLDLPEPDEEDEPGLD